MSWKLSHDCIVNTYGAFWPNQSQAGIPPKTLAIDIAEGIHHLHSNKIVHRDLKPENVLRRIIDDRLVSRAKLCDFGASREMRSTILQKSISSTEMSPLYAPPEKILSAKTTYSYDLWSYGLLLFWLDGAKTKAPRASPDSISELVRSGKVMKECAEQCPRSRV